jgi:hypothetical protein
MSDDLLVFIDGLLKCPGVDYIVEWETGQPANSGGIFLIFKEQIKPASNICVVLNGTDMWFKVSSIDNSFVDQSKDRPSFDERMAKWL